MCQVLYLLAGLLINVAATELTSTCFLVYRKVRTLLGLSSYILCSAVIQVAKHNVCPLVGHCHIMFTDILITISLS